jgi:hypothetical protein
MLDISIARGRAIFTMRALAYTSNCKMVNVSIPFPTKSSKYTQMNCISKMNIAIKNVIMKGPM